MCDPNNPNSQLYAKAYPTIRELNLANKLGGQGIVSSICPIDVSDNAAGNDPLFGYRPAVASIINRLKNALTNQCLPQKLDASDAGAGVPCLILATLPAATSPSNPQADCTSGKYPGYSAPDPNILAEFQSSAEATWVAGRGRSGAGSEDAPDLPGCAAHVSATPGDLDSRSGLVQGLGSTRPRLVLRHRLGGGDVLAGHRVRPTDDRRRDAGEPAVHRDLERRRGGELGRRVIAVSERAGA